MKSRQLPAAFLLIWSLVGLTVAAEKKPIAGEVYSDQEKRWRSEGLTLIPYKPNYFFPITYNTSPHPTSTNREQYKEAKFQLSFKILLFNDIMGTPTHLFFGYTQLCFWQVYDRERSAPFRDTDYEPELLVAFDTTYRVGQFLIPEIDVGMVHQSNGATGEDSRGWNRIYARFLMEQQNLSLIVKPWVPLPDNSDDNPDIEKYMGYGEFTVSYRKKNHVLSMMLRNNLRFKENKGAIELDYSFPLTRNLTGLVQWFNGYGESLIDYNRPTNRYSIGIALSTWR